MSTTSSFQRVWEILRCSIYEDNNEQLLNFHIITHQIPTSNAPNRFQEPYNVKHFKVIKRLKSPKKAEKQPKRPFMMEIFCECT